MRRFLIVLLISVISVSAFCQTPNGAAPLYNDLSDKLKKEEIMNALPLSLEMYRVYVPYFWDAHHRVLSKRLIEDDYGIKVLSFLKVLISKGDPEIKEMLTPLYLWGKVRYSNDSVRVNESFTDLTAYLEEGTGFANSKAETYMLMTLKELEDKPFVSKKRQQEVLKKVVANLEACECHESDNRDQLTLTERAWSRYLLAQSYHYRYEHFDQNPEYLGKSAQYSPDQMDLAEKRAFQMDAFLFTGQMELLKYRIEYFSWLDKEGEHAAALEQMASIAFAYPSDTNMKLLMNYYADHGGKQDFPVYWQAHINSQGAEVPNLKFRFSKHDKINFSDKQEKWLMFDFWGTWCPPCIKEMPEVQAFYHENLTRGGVPKLLVYTLSFMSENLSRFMDENDYTFPVAEIDRKDLNAFGVSSFPTKVLVTPEGQYVVIPLGADWKLFVKNYVLL
ncbi:redoxin domain-containing protein [Echinicola soli]|uniref:Redoxin domain-containing protein n=1 Tax=Echinicola soli TaxID=2591634 RepID=A0A514CDD6_9BACT|nr:redoxin domain-containing protein [Echinicola soli]QDH77832.1 redoxin domain-containing protein [Echinicola soli]